MVDLTNNVLTEVSNASTSSLRALGAGLTTLRLAQNRIAWIQSGVLDQLPWLQELDLSGNRLTQLTAGLFGAGGLVQLKVLDVSNNGIARIAPGLLSALDNLETLDLSGNSLTAITADLFAPDRRRRHRRGTDVHPMPKLESLDFGNNARLVEIQPHALVNLSVLRTLSFAGSPIALVGEGSLAGLFDGLQVSWGGMNLTGCPRHPVNSVYGRCTGCHCAADQDECSHLVWTAPTWDNETEASVTFPYGCFFLGMNGYDHVLPANLATTPADGNLTRVVVSNSSTSPSGNGTAFPNTSSVAENECSACSAGPYTRWNTTRTMFAIGSSYRFLPVVAYAEVNGTAIDQGDMSFDVFNAPTGVFIQSSDGEIFVNPRRVGTYSTTVRALYGKGGRVAIDTLPLDFRYSDVDRRSNATGPNGRGCANGGTRTDTCDGVSEFDGSYTCDCSITPFTGDENCETFPPVADAVVNNVTTELAESIVRFSNTSDLFGISGAKVQYAVGEDSTSSQPTSPNIITLERRWWAVGVAYHIMPVFDQSRLVGTLDLSSTSNCGTSLASSAAQALRNPDISFELHPIPAGFVINPTTGELFGKPGACGRTNSTLTMVRTVTDSGDMQAHYHREETALAVITFEFMFSDVDNRSGATGPNGRACDNGGSKIDSNDDEREFDGRYTCDCSATPYPDDANCEGSPPPASQESAAATEAAISIGLGAALVLVLAVLLLARVRIHNLKHRPVDVGAILAELLQNMGVAGGSDILPHELGICIKFDQLPEELRGAGSSQPPENWGPFQAAVVAWIKTAAPELSASAGMARMSAVEQQKDTFMVVMPRLMTSAEQAVATLVGVVRTARQGRPDLASVPLRTAGSKSARDSNVAFAVEVWRPLPRLLPREFNRKSLVRVGQLGEGEFGRVDKYEVHEHDRGVPNYFVAGKSVKAGNSAFDIYAQNEGLLTEAALMGVLQHRNIVRLVGVVTTPRDLPVLVIIELCTGSLEEHLVSTATSGGGNLSDASRLTYCAEICRGMAYLSTRRIIHRDLAARNVLLDGNLVCKISDFGRAAALAVDGDKEYVRSADLLPLRHAAIEVIDEEKYSARSDVWSFGVVAWEIWSKGMAPYNQFGNSAEVAAFVQGGGVLDCPAACDTATYRLMMLPCWAAVPEARPSFAELYSELVHQGAIEDEEAVAETTRSQASICRPSAVVIMDSSAPQQGPSLAERKLNGPTVHYLCNKLLDATVTAAAEWIVAANLGLEVHQPLGCEEAPEAATISDMVLTLVKPKSIGRICPRDGETGVAFVDLLDHPDDVGKAKALLSYTWRYALRDVCSALSAWATSEHRTPKQTPIWICSLCINQHRDFTAMYGSPKALGAEFSTRIVSIGRILPMLTPWDQPAYINRLWCLYELYTAIRLGQCDISVILPPGEIERIRHGIMNSGYSVVDAVLSRIKCEEATAWSEDDQQYITELIQDMPGGFDTLNERVKTYLRRWYVDQGGIDVHLFPPSPPTSPTSPTSPGVNGFHNPSPTSNLQGTTSVRTDAPPACGEAGTATKPSLSVDDRRPRRNQIGPAPPPPTNDTRFSQSAHIIV